jgi:hypothetical protein
LQNSSNNEREYRRKRQSAHRKAMRHSPANTVINQTSEDKKGFCCRVASQARRVYSEAFVFYLSFTAH